MSLISIAALGLWTCVFAQPDRAPAPTSQPQAISSATHDFKPETPSPNERRVRPTPLAGQQLLDHFGLIKGNNTPEARRLGATRLIEAGSDEAIAKLADVLQSKPADLAAQIAVCEAIADADGPDPALIAPLLALLGDKRPGLGDAVVQGLLRFESEAVVGQLGPMAKDESLDAERRLAAINALGVIGDSLQAVEALVGLLKDSGRTVASAALASMRQATGADLADTEAAINWWNEHQGISDYDWLRRRNAQRSAEIHRLATEVGTLTARLAAAYRDAYHKNSEPDRPGKLLALLNDVVPGIRLLGLDLVNDLITDRKDVPSEVNARLVELLTDPTASVRMQAAKIVGDLRLVGAFARLTQAIAHEDDPSVRVAQVNAIGRLDDPALLQILLERLDDDIPSVAGEAALALGRASRRTDWAKIGSPEGRASITPILIDRWGRIHLPQSQLREQLLTGMSMIGDARFRTVFNTEMSGNRDIHVRRAAIAGIAGFADLEAADAVRTCLNDADAEVRLAAADGLAKCGRRRGDLGALAEHLDPTGEPGAAVRQRCWESYQFIAAQMSPEEQIKISDEFDRPTDKVAQRRRLDLLKPLASDTRVSGSQGAKTGTAKFETLPKARRAEVLERIADAQWNLGDFIATAASLDQVLGLMDGTRNGRYVALAARSIAARLKAHEDAVAVERVKELLKALREESSAAPALLETVFDEIRSRTESATEAAMFADLLALIDLIGPIVKQAGALSEQSFNVLSKNAIAKRIAAIDRLLGSLPNDPDSEAKILAYPKEAVLARLVEKLRAVPATTGPVTDADGRIIQLAKRLSPNWTGFPSDATPDQRSAALEKLLNAPATKSPNGASAARHPNGASVMIAPAPEGKH